jgi:signal transduction histidine kinase
MVQLWLPTDQGTVEKTVGRMAPLADRDQAFPGFSIAISPPKGKTSDIYIRLTTKSVFKVDLALGTQSATTRYGMMYGLILGGILGFLIFSGAANIIVGGWLKDWSYLSFGIYSLMVTSAAIVMDGFTGYFLPDFHSHSDTVQGMAICLSGISGQWCALLILRINRYYPRLALIFYASIILDLVIAVLVLNGYYAVIPGFFNPKGLLITVLVLGIAIHQALRGIPSSLFFLAGYAVYLFSVIYDILSLYWPLPNLTPFLRLSIVGLLLQVISFSLGLAYRIRTVTAEKERIQEDALTAAKQTETTLALRVAERTASLEAEINWRKKIEADLTSARINAETALKQTNIAMREQRNFLAMVSHEFRTPLGIISASAELLKLGLTAGDPENLEELEKIRRAQYRMVKLVDTCLTDDWLSSASEHRRSEPLDLKSLLEDGALFHPRVVLASHAGGTPLTVEGNPTLLPVAFANLMDNAAKYSPPDSPIEVVARTAGETAVIEVMDRGIGIAPDDLPRIFEKYYRAPTVQAKPGAGIGLHLVQRIVSIHNGEIEVAPRPGGGSVFTVRLPLSLSLRPEAEFAIEGSKA